MAAEPHVPGRMERVTATDPDPRARPALHRRLRPHPRRRRRRPRALRPTTRGRLVVVLGAGGDRDRGKRRAMGAAAGRWADHVIVTDDNPRTEDPAAIRAEVEQERRGRGPERGWVWREPSLRAGWSLRAKPSGAPPR